jgi:hypothetical protein
MKRSSGPRRTTDLCKSIQQHLDMYALAASAAGVGMLALGSAYRGEDHLHPDLPYSAQQPLFHRPEPRRNCRFRHCSPVFVQQHRILPSRALRG